MSGVPADPMEQCIECGREERHLQTKRDGWEPEFVDDTGGYVLRCPECKDPDPGPCRTLGEFLPGEEVRE